MQRDGWYSKTRNANDLEDAKAVGKKAAQRTVARLGARKLTTRQTPVIFEASVAASLFSAFIGAISGGALYRKASFMLDKINQQIFSDHIHIHENPFVPGAMGSAAFDSDGMATRAHDIVRDGILKSYVLSAYSARKLELPPTGNAGGVHNLFIEPGSQDLNALISSMHKGLLVTDMIGFGVNQMTGDYSRGASGFWVENGEIQYPVEEITVAGNLLDMYMQIISIGNDVDARRNIRTGSVLIENMTVAGE
jgi:PmbA protein